MVILGVLVKFLILNGGDFQVYINNRASKLVLEEDLKFYRYSILKTKATWENIAFLGELNRRHVEKNQWMGKLTTGTNSNSKESEIFSM